MNSPPALTPGDFFMPIAVLFSEKGALLSFPPVNPVTGLRHSQGYAGCRPYGLALPNVRLARMGYRVPGEEEMRGAQDGQIPGRGLAHSGFAQTNSVGRRKCNG